MSIQFDTLFGSQGGGTELAWPGVSYTGSFTRRVVQYGETWYYEWILTSSGTLTFEESLLVDLYLVAGGGNGTNGGTWTPEGESTQTYEGGGGGAGYPLALTARNLLGTYSVAIGSSAGNTTITIDGTTHTANKGGNGSVSNHSPVRGTGHSGDYLAYGDPNAKVGNTAGNSGANGTNLLSSIRAIPSNIYAYTRPGQSGTGYGAGGCGGIVTSAFSGTSIGPSNGAPGVVMMRVPIAA